MTYNNFFETPVWKKGQELVDNIYRLTQKLPRQEDYALTSQLRRAALGITGNIAEGFGRGHKKDKINFYFFARGSCFEVQSHLLGGQRVNYFSFEEINPLISICSEIILELKKIIKALQP